MSRISFPNSRMSSISLTGGIREILDRADELEAGGRSVIHMEIGRPDFDSPQCAKEKAKAALDAGDVHYTNMSGTAELRQEIAQKLVRENRLDVNPDTNVVVTGGAIEALMLTFLTVLEPGDEVLVPSPFFPAYTDQVVLANGRLVNVPCRPEEGFQLRFEDLQKALTPQSRAILLNTPNNPSGAVIPRAELEKIAHLAIEQDLLVISDECYEKFLYEGEHVSIGALPGMKERTVTVGAASKTWSMTGWRIGWAIVPDAMKPYAAKCHQNLTTCANAFAQAGVAQAFREAQSDVDAMVEEYRRRRDMVYSYIEAMEGLKVEKPAGAFYVFPSIEATGMNSMEFCMRLLEEEGVSAVPGDVFGTPGFIRLAYCRSYDYIEEGMRRLGRFVESKRQ